jgi:hypothetical protein
VIIPISHNGAVPTIAFDYPRLNLLERATIAATADAFGALVPDTPAWLETGRLARKWTHAARFRRGEAPNCDLITVQRESGGRRGEEHLRAPGCGMHTVEVLALLGDGIVMLDWPGMSSVSAPRFDPRSGDARPLTENFLPKFWC